MSRLVASFSSLAHQAGNMTIPKEVFMKYVLLAAVMLGLTITLAFARLFQNFRSNRCPIH
jgi:hypothetical protein